MESIGVAKSWLSGQNKTKIFASKRRRKIDAAIAIPRFASGFQNTRTMFLVLDLSRTRGYLLCLSTVIGNAGLRVSPRL